MIEDEERKQHLFDTDMLPDHNSSEAILYGSAYRFIKNAQWIWSSIEDYLKKKLRGLESQIMDREFAYDVLKHNRYVIFSPTPPFESPKKIRDCFTLRDLVRVQSALGKLDHFRQMNEMWARKQAIDEYISELRKNGLITPEDWKTCTAEFNMEPITYEYTHGTAHELGPEENIDWNLFVEALYGEDEKPSKAKEPEGSRFHLEVPEEEDETEDEDPSFEEVIGIVSQYIDDPVKDALSVLEDKDELLNTAYDWLDSSEWDPAEDIRYLIGYAEALA